MKPATNTVSIAAAADLIEACLENRVLTKTQLQSWALPCEPPYDPHLRLPEPTYIRLWECLASDKSLGGIALKIGQTINPEAKGLLASWVSQTHTLREALDIFSKNILLMNPSENWRLTEKNDTCELQLDITINKDYPTIAIERSMSAMVAWGRALSNHPFPIIQAKFTFKKPAYDSLFHPIFGKQITWEGGCNRLTFDSQLLDLAIVNSNTYLKQIIEQKARQTLNELTAGISVSTQAKTIIDKALSAGKTANIGLVSATLAISRQTLYRKLKQENTSFQELHELARKKMSAELLTSSAMKIEDIGLRLGFKDTSSFYKAFKRWYAVSPKEYRLRKHGNQ